jgi:hypothetical protein
VRFFALIPSIVFAGFISVGFASSLPPDYKAAVDDLRSIPGTPDFNVIEDVSKVVDEADKLITDLRSLDADQRAKQLERVRAERQQLVRHAAELRSALEGIRQLRGALQLAGGGPGLKELSLRKEAAESDLKVANYEKQKAVSDLGSAQEKDKPGITNYINEQDVKIKTKEADLEQLNTKIASLGTVSEGDAQRHLNSLETVSKEGQAVATSADFTLNNIDDLAGEMLTTTMFLSSYTNWSTIVFSALVALVIGSFFAITYKAGIGGQILSGDSGIQFVTLFALIIAIILFGVLKILEGKELAALLGGLSGYILGRGSGAQRDASMPQSPNNRKSEATDSATPSTTGKGDTDSGSISSVVTPQDQGATTPGTARSSDQNPDQTSDEVNIVDKNK